MIKFLQHITLLCCVGLVASLGSCNTDGLPDGKNYTAAEVGRNVNLSLNVSIGKTTGVRQTRDGETPEIDGNFVTADALNEYELIKTLRVIIVRPDNTIEFNRLIQPKDQKATNLLNSDNVGENELKFLVSTSQGYVDNEAMTCTERKRIYLIANENTLDNFKSTFTGDGDKITDLLNGLVPAFTPTKEEEEEGVKGKLDPYVVERWTIYNDWEESGDPDSDVNDLLALPIINNEGEQKSYIPMTEFFDIDVVSSWKPTAEDSNTGDTESGDTPSEGNNSEGNTAEDEEWVIEEQTAELFVTRNFVKFQFTASSNTEKFDVVNIRFENVMQKEYLFPFNTIYDPVKSVNNPVDRQILSFQTPGLAGNRTRAYVFTPTTPFSYTPPDPATPDGTVSPASYSPELYFCETHNFLSNTTGLSLYTVGADIRYYTANGTKTEVVSYPADKELNNLPYSLPRNTIVRVNLILQDRKLAAEATIYPYTAVNLNPQFGIGKPVSDVLTVAPTMELNIDIKGLLSATYTSEKGNTIDKIFWVSSNPNVVLLEPEFNDYEDPEDLRYVKPSASIELPYKERVKVFPQNTGTAYVTAYTNNGLVARCQVTVK